MCIDTRIPRSASQGFPIFVRNMLTGSGITKSFRQTEVDDVNEVGLLSQSYKEVIGFDVSVYDVSRMEILDPR